MNILWLYRQYHYSQEQFIRTQWEGPQNVPLSEACQAVGSMLSAKFSVWYRQQSAEWVSLTL